MRTFGNDMAERAQYRVGSLESQFKFFVFN